LICNAAIVVGNRPLRVEANGVAIVGDGAVEIALGFVGIATVVEGFA
jgi:hypothetical protein